MSFFDTRDIQGHFFQSFIEDQAAVSEKLSRYVRTCACAQKSVVVPNERIEGQCQCQQTNRQENGQTRTNTQTDRQKHKDRQTDRQTDTDIETCIQLLVARDTDELEIVLQWSLILPAKQLDAKNKEQKKKLPGLKKSCFCCKYT